MLDQTSLKRTQENLHGVNVDKGISQPPKNIDIQDQLIVLSPFLNTCCLSTNTARLYIAVMGWFALFGIPAHQLLGDMSTAKQ